MEFIIQGMYITIMGYIYAYDKPTANIILNGGHSEHLYYNQDKGVHFIHLIQYKSGSLSKNNNAKEASTRIQIRKNSIAQ